MSDDAIEDLESFRARAKEWIEATLPSVDEPKVAPLELQRVLFDGGFAGIAFPPEYGGAGLTLQHQKVFQDTADELEGKMETAVRDLYGDQMEAVRGAARKSEAEGIAPERVAEIVSEALTNVGRHSEATDARVTVRDTGDLLRIEVWDNGRGGADPAAGTGLAGLGDRVHAVDGAFRVDSPAAGPTTIRAEIPCEL